MAWQNLATDALQISKIWWIVAGNKLQASPKKQSAITGAHLAIMPFACENNLAFIRNDLYCVEWGVKLYSLTHD